MSLATMLARVVIGALVSTLIACIIAIVYPLPLIDDAQAIFSLCVFFCVLETIVQSIRIEQRRQGAPNR